MNFLSITVDDLNAFAFLQTLYGGTLSTPNIDRLMAMGTTFENAFAQTAICNPSRTSVLSGLTPGITGVHYNTENWFEHVDPAATLPGMLNHAGFDTSIIGKVFHSRDMPGDVSQTVAGYVFESPRNALENSWIDDPHPFPLSEGEHSDYINVDHAIDVLNASGTDPFALFLGLSKPHVGWVVPQQYFDLYPAEDIVLPATLDGDLADIPAFIRALLHFEDQALLGGTEGWQKALQGYFASISFADAMIGRVLDTLEANGQLADTAIVLWTDHGWHLGDKDNWRKFTLWEEAAQAPIVIALPGSEDNGQRVGQVVELVDIMPTVLDLLGLGVPEGLSGRSLRPFIEDPSLIDDGVAITTMYGSAAIRTNDYRYIRYEDGSTELYDLSVDPHQWRNLALDPLWDAVERQLDAQLRTEMAEDGWRFVEDGQAALGGAGAQVFVLEHGAVRAEGGGGDDTYFVNDSATVVRENARGGVDTVYTSVSFTLPDNVEVLHFTSARQPRNVPLVFIGNDSANFFRRVTGHVEGRGGDDRIQLVGAGFVDGGDGNDVIQGGQSANELRGGSGDDRIQAMGGNDLVTGGIGNDFLSGGSGDDDLRGGDGNDTLFGSTGRDVMRGGAGDDLYFVQEIGDIVREQLGLGHDEVRARANYALTAGVEDLRLLADARVGFGNNSANLVAGNGAHNILRGYGGDDVLLGKTGRDFLSGHDGADRLIGGDGRDTLSGGAGADLFVFDDGSSAARRGGADIITDFSSAEDDRIVLFPIDADTGAVGNQRFKFIDEALFSGTAGEVRYVIGSGVTWVEADVNGDRIADFALQLDGEQILAAGDFLL